MIINIKILEIGNKMTIKQRVRRNVFMSKEMLVLVSSASEIVNQISGAFACIICAVLLPLQFELHLCNRRSILLRLGQWVFVWPWKVKVYSHRRLGSGTAYFLLWTGYEGQCPSTFCYLIRKMYSFTTAGLTVISLWLVRKRFEFVANCTITEHSYCSTTASMENRKVLAHMHNPFF